MPIGAAFSKSCTARRWNAHRCRITCHLLTAAENAQVKAMLIRIVSMPTKLVQRRHQVRENPAPHGHLDYDGDYDNDAVAESRLRLTRFPY